MSKLWLAAMGLVLISVILLLVASQTLRVAGDEIVDNDLEQEERSPVLGQFHTSEFTQSFHQDICRNIISD